MNNKNGLKLGKCPNCSSAFYIRTEKKDNVKLTCPFCKQVVFIKLKPKGEKDGNT